MARLRQGRANTARGAAHFLRETISRVRYAGATGQLTVRADSGFYNHAIVAACRKLGVRYSITVRQRQSVRNIIAAIPEEEWTPIPYWMEGATDVAETEYTPFQHEPDAVPVRLIVRRVKPTPGSQLALFTTYSYHAFITDRDGDTLELEADHRRHAEIENAIRDPASSAGQVLKYGVGLNHLPSGRFPANPEPAEGGLAGCTSSGLQPGTLDHAHRSGRTGGNRQDPAPALLLPPLTPHPQGPPPHHAPPPGLALAKPVQLRPGPIARPAPPLLTPFTVSDPSTGLPNRLADLRQAGPLTPSASGRR